ncbi:Flp family type IVb pilin [Nocardioides pocheonensis]|uniref:Flp family type IVb pilin n=1 Tax=Nocardioides pocheonensis TaxID=661485 RepID=A0A3N0GPU7_9ACTN|nr:Flp family type IVb pilin [Nocardioides pocheonensis]RNM14120.1 Flp family type IVb pilin [Nocardioides pocheonensis]
MNRHLTSEDGASAVEYGLLITGIAGLIVAMVFVFGGFVGGVFSDSCTKVRNQVAAGNACS